MIIKLEFLPRIIPIENAVRRLVVLDNEGETRNLKQIISQTDENSHQ